MNPGCNAGCNYLHMHAATYHCVGVLLLYVKQSADMSCTRFTRRKPNQCFIANTRQTLHFLLLWTCVFKQLIPRVPLAKKKDGTVSRTNRVCGTYTTPVAESLLSIGVHNPCNPNDICIGSK
jgi:hypothetical protein